MDGSGPRIAINGFGRIGRLVMRALREMDADVDLVAINDLSDRDTLAHLLRYDSVHGRYVGDVATVPDGLAIDGDRFLVFSERDPRDLPWKELDIDVVIEASGHFTDDAKAHLEAGAKRVVLTAPGKGVDRTVVRGVNDHEITPQDRLISNASCTTNCLAVVAKVLDDAFTIRDGAMTTIHAATNDQAIVDRPHKDLRRARATLGSMIPTTTGAARAVGLVLPHLEGKLDGWSVRVPTNDVSLLDLTVRTQAKPDRDGVLAALQAAADGPLKDLLGISHAPLVSIDFVHDTRSAIVDAETVSAHDGLVKLMAWYDNEWGYANRVAEVAMQATA